MNADLLDVVADQIENAPIGIPELKAIAKALLDEFFSEFSRDADGQPIPVPEFKIVNQLRAGWLARDTYRIVKNRSGDVLSRGENSLIEIQKNALTDKKTVERLIAHELIHHVVFLAYGPTSIDFRMPHGPAFRKLSEKINNVRGKGFVTEESDVSYELAPDDKPVFMLIRPVKDNKFAYQVSLRSTPQQKEATQYAVETYEARLVQTKGSLWASRGFPIKKFGKWSFPPDDADQQKLRELFESAKPAAAASLFATLADRVEAAGGRGYPEVLPFPRAYHGSREAGLEELEGGYPPYEGGLGYGVYVDNKLATARFYGGHIYEVEMKFPEHLVFDLSAENQHGIQSLEGNSILMGETIYPFMFQLKDKWFAVIGGDDENESFEDALRREYAGDEFAKLGNPTDEIGAVAHKLVAQAIVDNKKIDSWDMAANYVGEVYFPEYAKKNGHEPTDQEGDAVEEELRESIEAIESELNDLIEKRMPELIGLGEVGRNVQEAGYKAVYFERGGEPGTELLVFDEDDVEIVRELE